MRKKSKKLRRKLIRQKNAQEKQQNLAKSYLTKSYLTNLAEQKILEILNEEKEDKLYLENYQKWLQTEKEFQEAFRAKQSAQDLECLRATEANINEPEKSNFSDIEFLLNDIEAYIDGSSELPAQLLRYVETNNEMELCQFYLKTGCCRFGKLCIKNHIQPGITYIFLFLLYILFCKHFIVGVSRVNYPYCQKLSQILSIMFLGSCFTQFF